MANKMKTEDAKKVKKMQDKAEKDAVKLAKNFKKVQEKADKMKEKLEKEMKEEEQGMMVFDNSEVTTKKKGSDVTARRASMAPVQVQSFSEMVSVDKANSKGAGNAGFGGTIRGGGKKLGTLFVKNKATKKPTLSKNTFNVTSSEDGKKTVRHLSGLRRDSEVMFMPPEERAEINRLAALEEENRSNNSRPDLSDTFDSSFDGSTRRGTGKNIGLLSDYVL